MIIPLPDDAFRLPDRNDDGKKVVINSVGGCFQDESGVVIYGPYSYPYALKREKKNKEKPIWVHYPYERMSEEKKQDSVNFIHGNAKPQWYIEVRGRCFNFNENEFKF